MVYKEVVFFCVVKSKTIKIPSFYFHNARIIRAVC